ncbi:MAG: HDOD domain-containing protein [Epsilonproteobacteria bacterium]|nr:HDOD domain-containing protein [Campylobacterota bacterium]
MTEGLLDRIKSIPPLPKTFIEIEKIYRSDDGTISEMSKVVEKDPMLVANILKLVNSPLYGLRNEIKSVSQAVSMLGMKEVYTLSAAVSVKKLLKVDMEPYGVEPERFAMISNMQGAMVRYWLKKVDFSKADALFMPALLQETGKIIIADEIVKNDEVFQFKSDIQSATDISQVEKMYVDTTSSVVTAKIFEHWGFDDFIVNIIKYSDSYQSAPDEYREFSMYLKVIKTAVAVNSPLSERNIAIATHMVEKESANKEGFLDAVKQIKEQYGDKI